MGETAQASNHPQRLNPFVFPSQTDLRFVLLVASVLGASLFIYDLLYLSVPANSRAAVAAYSRCFAASGMARATPAPVHEQFARTATFNSCMTATRRANAAGMALGMATLLAVAATIYWLFPAWKCRRERLRPLDAEDVDEEVVTYLAGLCREAGLSRPPRFVWDPLDAASHGLAFGRVGDYYVALSGGLVTQFYTDRPAFRAVVLHELAHLRNADVTKTYLTVAVWWAFVAVALAPFVLAFAYALLRFGRGPGDLARLGWPVIPLALLVYLSRNAVLRTREIYADVRASVWDGPDGALRRLLGADMPAPGGWWRAALRAHPQASERRRALDDTRPLFRMGPWEALATGVAATIGFPSVVTLFSHLAPGNGPAWAAALVFAPLTIGVVGVGLWRATFAALAERERPRGSGVLALGLGAGFALGLALSFDTALSLGTPMQAAYPTAAALAIGSAIGCVLVLLVALAVLLRWVVEAASVWLEVGPPRPAGWGYPTGLVIASGVLATWCVNLYLVFTVRVPYLQSLRAAPFATSLFFLASPAHEPEALVGFICLWAYPFAAWLWRPPRAASATWWDSGWLTAPPAAIPRPRVSPSSLLGAAVAGMLAGLCFCALEFVARVLFHVGVPPFTRASGERFIAFTAEQVVIAAAIQAVVAALVAARARWLRLSYGSFTAFVAGCVMTGGMLGVKLLLVGGHLYPEDMWFFFSAIVGTGAPAALFSSLVVTALGGKAISDHRMIPLSAGRRTRP